LKKKNFFAVFENVRRKTDGYSIARNSLENAAFSVPKRIKNEFFSRKIDGNKGKDFYKKTAKGQLPNVLSRLNFGMLVALLINLI
jgi:hypothetical protein